MKILVIGGSSVIGSQIISGFKIKNFDVYFTYLKNNYLHGNGYHLDITHKSMTVELIKKIKPDIIIHCSALTNVDKCETEKDIAYKINVEGIENVVKGGENINSKIIFISTSAVYSGEKSKYDELEKTNPISYYGITKANAEEIVVKSGLTYLILRTDQPYFWKESWQHTNSVLRTIGILREGKILKEVSNWKNTPTYIPNFVHATMTLIENKMEGIFHVTGNEYISRYEMALKTAEIFNLNKKLVIPINSDELHLPAKRANVNLQNKKLLKTTGFKMYDFKKGLKDMSIHSND